MLTKIMVAILTATLMLFVQIGFNVVDVTRAMVLGGGIVINVIALIVAIGKGE